MTVKSSVQEEIDWYKPKKAIVDGMLMLERWGFEFSGHGCGFGGEDFGMIFEYQADSDGPEGYFYFNFCDEGNKVVATITDNPEGEPDDVLYVGTVGRGLKLIRKRVV